MDVIYLSMLGLKLNNVSKRGGGGGGQEYMTKEPTHDFYTKDTTTLATLNPIVYIRQQPVEVVNFISGVCGIPLDSIYSDRGLSFQISTICEQIRKMYPPNYIGQASFMHLMYFRWPTVMLRLKLNHVSKKGGGQEYVTKEPTHDFYTKNTTTLAYCGKIKRTSIHDISSHNVI